MSVSSYRLNATLIINASKDKGDATLLFFILISVKINLYQDKLESYFLILPITLPSEVIVVMMFSFAIMTKIII
ncbi:hypothetical protein BCLUESOX_829 [bacterium endosymbiont of Bathymodiolus sp. 5 South]|nr:hypothetical protein BCLUESOX_829 [bacterium endosymbiont of Bathymodiolus sp. 5 South]VVH58790.1 hypothetical protein BSPCLSOX_1049 [uncultured Gammaproteobacteria bacterium]VVH61841.1 hypothetical protein BSPWISOX_168 [uncultured Gammaproteobacteria bacterium]VVM27713.1 hypothetical protein BSPWISOXPB_6716 [uncultured Gammaproteobacteria bacterium]